MYGSHKETSHSQSQRWQQKKTVKYASHCFSTIFFRNQNLVSVYFEFNSLSMAIDAKLNKKLADNWFKLYEITNLSCTFESYQIEGILTPCVANLNTIPSSSIYIIPLPNLL